MVALVLFMVGAVAAHHGGIDAMEMGEAMVVCLAVVPVLVAAAVVGGLLPRPRYVPADFVLPPRVAEWPPWPRARPSPLVLVVLRR